MPINFSPNKMFAVNISANHVYVHICLCQMYHMSISTYTSYHGHFICKWTDIHARKWKGCRLHYTWVKRLVSQWLLFKITFQHVCFFSSPWLSSMVCRKIPIFWWSGCTFCVFQGLKLTNASFTTTTSTFASDWEKLYHWLKFYQIYRTSILITNFV